VTFVLSLIAGGVFHGWRWLEGQEAQVTRPRTPEVPFGKVMAASRKGGPVVFTTDTGEALPPDRLERAEQSAEASGYRLERVGSGRFALVPMQIDHLRRPTP
jgi:hypothetical protein